MQVNQTKMLDTTPTTLPKPTLYFAYGSNLSLSQMKQRCPGSTYLALAHLKSWRWVISPRGYANIVRCENDDERKRIHGEKRQDGNGGSVVYGLVYALSLDGRDEDRLDDAEGVPWAYEKMWMEVEVEGGDRDADADAADREGERLAGQKLNVLVYADPRGEELIGRARDEYVVRMNRAIEESVPKGIPMAYVEDVIRPFIPA